jgi:membrane-associated phospholipid phosphatase
MTIAGTAGTWLSWRYFVETAIGQRIDGTAFRGSRIGRNVLWRAVEPVLDIVSVPFIAAVLGAAVVIAIARRRWFLAVQVAALVGGANVTTQVLKRLVLDRPPLIDDGGSAGNSLPSGHTTVATSIAAAFVLVVPRRIRPPCAVLGAGYAALTGVSTMVGGWHRPSDVIAGMTVVLAWAGLTTILTAFGSSEQTSVTTSRHSETLLFGSFLAMICVAAGIGAGWALTQTRDHLRGISVITSRAGLATAYLGAWLGVVAVAALSFAAILIAHQDASRSVEKTHQPS